MHVRTKEIITQIQKTYGSDARVATQPYNTCTAPSCSYLCYLPQMLVVVKNSIVELLVVKLL